MFKKLIEMLKRENISYNIYKCKCCNNEYISFEFGFYLFGLSKNDFKLNFKQVDIEISLNLLGLLYYKLYIQNKLIFENNNLEIFEKKINEIINL